MPADPFEQFKRKKAEVDPFEKYRRGAQTVTETAPPPAEPRKKTPEEIEKYIEEQTTDPSMLFTDPAEYGRRMLGMGERLGRSVPVLGPAAVKTGRAIDESIFGETEGRKTFEQEEAEYRKKFPQKAAAESIVAGMAGPSLIGPAGRAFKGAEGVIGRGAQALGNIGLRTGAAGGEAAVDAMLRGDIDPRAAAEQVGGVTVFLDTLQRAVPTFYRSVVAGMSPKLIKRYKANRAAVNAADEEAFVRKIEKMVKEQKGVQEEAQKIAREAREATTDAKALLKEQLKGEMPPESLPDEILEDAQKLRKMISQKSSESFDILSESNVTIPTKPIIDKLVKKAKDFDIGGKDPLMPELRQGKNQMIMMAKQVQAMGPEANPVEVKKFIQVLDRLTEDVYQAQKFGGYVGLPQRQLVELRSDLNEYLLQIPEYAKAMAPLREATQLSSQLNKRYSDPQKIGKTLRWLNKYDAREDRKILEDLGRITKKEYLTRIRPYEEARARLDPMNLKKEFAKLPEAQTARYFENVVEGLKDSNEYLKELSKPIQAVERLTREGKRLQYPTRDALIKLGRKNQVDLLDELDKIAIKKAMDRQFIRGGRNVYMTTFSIGGLAGLLAKMSGVNPEAAQMAGQAAGSAIGGASDVFGPKAVKFLIDIQADFPHLVKPIKSAYEKGPKTMIMEIIRQQSKDPDFAQYLEQQKVNDQMRIERLRR